jgi:hypothetical protein
MRCNMALVRINGRAAYVRAHAEHGDLPEAHGFLVGHAEDIERGEVRTQQACAVHQPLEGNDHRQHAIHCEPAIGVIEKQPLHAVVRHLANLGVVGRIQIEQRKGLRLGDGVEGIALNGLDAFRLSNQCARSASSSTP